MATNAAMISLGDMTDRAKHHVRSGRYDTLDEVVRAGIAALDREEAAFEAYCRKKVQEALDDPRPPVSMEEAFARLDAMKAARIAR